MDSQSIQQLEEELQENEGASEDSGDQGMTESLVSSNPSVRGRPRLPIVWSKVVHVTPDCSSQIKEHWISVDTQLHQALRSRVNLEPTLGWKMEFFPNEFAKEHDIQSLDDWRLTESQLKVQGKNISKLREEIRKRALKMAEKVVENG